MRSFALVRADDSDKVKIALHDLEKYGNIQFSDTPRCIESEYADELLVSVMGVTLKEKCNSAALVEIKTNAGAAIGRLKKIHPPAHVIIISPKHKIFEDISRKFKGFPNICREFTPVGKIENKPGSTWKKVENKPAPENNYENKEK